MSTIASHSPLNNSETVKAATHTGELVGNPN